MDSIKIALGLYQYTADDDCLRWKVAELQPARTPANTLQFIDPGLDAFAVPVQTIQTYRGSELIAFDVQLRLRELLSKLRPTAAGSPHGSGKVERTQCTVLEEFHSAGDSHSDEPAARMAPVPQLSADSWRRWYQSD